VRVSGTSHAIARPAAMLTPVFANMYQPGAVRVLPVDSPMAWGWEVVGWWGGEVARWSGVEVLRLLGGDGATGGQCKSCGSPKQGNRNRPPRAAPPPPLSAAFRAGRPTQRATHRHDRGGEAAEQAHGAAGGDSGGAGQRRARLLLSCGKSNPGRNPAQLRARAPIAPAC
jgi:hypothetical protein